MHLAMARIEYFRDLAQRDDSLARCTARFIIDPHGNDGAGRCHPLRSESAIGARAYWIGRMELEPTDLILRRRTDLGFTRDRHIKCASRLQPTCGAPSRRMAAGLVSLVAVLRDARNSSRRAP